MSDRMRPRRPVAVIDIGSNSGRVVVHTLDAAGHLRVLAGSRASLRLVHDVDEQHELSEESMARTMAAVRDFHAVAVGAGASPIVAVATSAMREARNGQLLRDRIRRDIGLRLDIIDGRAEARHGFVGAIRSLPVSSGILFDLGGGSMQVSQFRHRRLGRNVSLPLGALRLSETFLTSDPPGAAEIRRLQKYVRSQLKDGHVGRVRSGDWLVGTGGTIRNLAKIDRSTMDYPIDVLHGYEIPLERLHGVVRRLATARERRRDAIDGLSAQRADSVVGGALAIEALLEVVGANGVLVSGHGLREGVALDVLGAGMASTAEVVESTLASLTMRFDGWQRATATRRRAVAAALLRGLDPRADARMAVALDRGARLLDIGRSLDYFDRYRRSADLLLATELTGFTHEEIALLSGLVRLAGDRHAEPDSLRPLVAKADR
ncbi:MAG: Ppx/GppA family phosphatase, partial [Acidobacteriota bacterium]|nr:Ppx/GppA family phosphatase [Acidobacteriota bacterium]